MKEICVYYSLTNNVKSAVEKMDCESFEIQVEKPLPNSKFLQFLILGFKVSFNKKIAIKKVTKDFSEFEHIIIYAPVWSGKLAIPMNEFLNIVKFKNKKITLIASCGGNSGKTKEVFLKNLDSSNEFLEFREIKTR